MQITIKDYEEWLKNDKKAKVAKKGESLSAFDEQENRALYNQYVNEANLYNQRIESERQLDEQKSSALRDHYVSSEKAEKKAEDIARMQGITTGASQSDLIDIYAKGAAARAAIINENNAQRNDLLSKYNQAIAESKTSTNAAIGDISVKRLEEESRLKEENKKQNKSDFASYLSQYLAGTINKATLDRYYKDLHGDLDESTKNTYFDIDNQRADAKLAAAIENYGNGVIDYDALLKAYEEAGEYVDTDVKGYLDSETRKRNEETKTKNQETFAGYLNQYLAGTIDKATLNKYYSEHEGYLSDDLKRGYENADKEIAVKKFNATIENYNNGVGGVGYNELKKAYDSVKDYVDENYKSMIDVECVKYELNRLATQEISPSTFALNINKAKLGEDAKQELIKYISQESGEDAANAVKWLANNKIITKAAAIRIINSNPDITDEQKEKITGLLR